MNIISDKFTLYDYLQIDNTVKKNLIHYRKHYFVKFISVFVLYGAWLVIYLKVGNDIDLSVDFVFNSFDYKNCIMS